MDEQIHPAGQRRVVGNLIGGSPIDAIASGARRTPITPARCIADVPAINQRADLVQPLDHVVNVRTGDVVISQQVGRIFRDGGPDLARSTGWAQASARLDGLERTTGIPDIRRDHVVETGPTPHMRTDVTTRMNSTAGLVAFADHRVAGYLTEGDVSQAPRMDGDRSECAVIAARSAEVAPAASLCAPLGDTIYTEYKHES